MKKTKHNDQNLRVVTTTVRVLSPRETKAIVGACANTLRTTSCAGTSDLKCP
jgi:hypothetical protein